MIQRISYYGGRRVEDFDKYEALRYAEELASVAKSSSHPKAASYDVGPHHFAHRRVEEVCHIGNRIFKPISGHPLALFVTNVVNQGISHPSVGSVLLLVSLLLLLSLDLTILQHNFVVSAYAIKIFLHLVSYRGRSVCRRLPFGLP